MMLISSLNMNLAYRLNQIEGVDSSKNMFIEVTGNYGVILSGEGDDVFTSQAIRLFL